MLLVRLVALTLAAVIPPPGVVAVTQDACSQEDFDESHVAVQAETDDVFLTHRTKDLNESHVDAAVEAYQHRRTRRSKVKTNESYVASGTAHVVRTRSTNVSSSFHATTEAQCTKYFEDDDDEVYRDGLCEDIHKAKDKASNRAIKMLRTDDDAEGGDEKWDEEAAEKFVQDAYEDAVNVVLNVLQEAAKEPPRAEGFRGARLIMKSKSLCTEADFLHVEETWCARWRGHCTSHYASAEDLDYRKGVCEDIQKKGTAPYDEEINDLLNILEKDLKEEFPNEGFTEKQLDRKVECTDADLGIIEQWCGF